MMALLAGLWKLLQGLLAGLGKVANATGQWLRADHNWWRIGCFTAAFGCMVLTFALLDTQHEVVLVRETCTSQKDTLAAEAMTDLTRAQGETATCRVNLQAEVGRRQAVESLAELAIKHAGRTETEAAQELAEWQKRYDQRPKTCDDALKALDTLCPAL